MFRYSEHDDVTGAILSNIQNSPNTLSSLSDKIIKKIKDEGYEFECSNDKHDEYASTHTDAISKLSSSIKEYCANNNDGFDDPKFINRLPNDCTNDTIKRNYTYEL